MPITLNGTTGITNDGGYTGDGISFADTTPANTLVTTTGGNVGIGTTTPSSTIGFQKVLEIYDPTASTVQVNGGGTYKAEFGVGSNGGWLGTGTNDPMRFVTNNTERMRIASNGDLYLGQTAQTFSSKLGITSGANCGAFQTTAGVGDFCAAVFARNGNNGRVCEFNYSTATFVGSISVTSSATAYNTSSDYRLKENITPMSNALGVVAQLKPVTYKWKIDGSNGQGFIAHELQEVVPDCVTGEKDAVNEDGSIKAQGIDTSFLVATLTAAIQELKATVDAQAARIAALESAGA
jgi:hypothetical protein